MDRNEFMRRLRDEGFEQFVTVEREPNGALDEHTHPFEAEALVIAGEILIESGGVTQTVRAGETFHLAAGQPHSERYGPEGVSYLVGRK
ncbi:MAG: hypothetical protein AzoDbin1_00140 [Azoarcus sp.]|uniref:Cupin domain-containing protein n=1 Tax=Aromatoleum tolulyticum TaxID=34027 RepID=A0A1N6U530_9RHOO|nr:cupin domain-containing protein [Aromatoleum tolulyticum]MCK9983668.1 hypothetical protein [Azoarcus sp.]SIQ60714.1 Cupin domain-containing protein [Aromatoleum tolulyticum]